MNIKQNPIALMVKIRSESVIQILVPPKKNKAIIILIRIMLAYSARKMMAKPPLEYSTLNPETSSDSPSAKSKGARLVSATEIINQE